MKDLKTFVMKSFIAFAFMVAMSNTADSIRVIHEHTFNLDVTDAHVVASKHHLSKERNCENNEFCKSLAEAVFFEGRGESLEGQYAIAFAVRNRRDSSNGQWPDDVRSVINQRINGTCQFSYICQFTREALDSKIRAELESWRLALKIAYDVYFYEVEDKTGGADHFYNPNAVTRTPRFAQVYTVVGDIGNHRFYRSY